MFENINEAVQAATPAPSTAAPQKSQFANVPEFYEDPLTGVKIKNAGYTPQPTAEEITVSQAQRISELEAALQAAQVQGRLTPVQLPNGSTLTTQEAEKQLSEMSVWAQVESLKSQRFIQDLAEQQEVLLASQPASSSVPLLNRDSAEKLMGRDAWKSASNSVKAAALDIRKSDVDKLKVEDYFGRDTSRAAHELGKSNPAMYALLREKAVEKGIIAPRGATPGPKSTIRAFGV